MATAKDIHVAPISQKDAAALVKRVHYSGKVVNNSQLHFGVFLNGRIEGAMQFGPSLDKRKIQGLVDETGWNNFIELNRMAFSDVLPRNSESRAMAVAFRLIKKHYPHIDWVISFADGTQCGDGAIYRAAGFVLTGLKVNSQIWEAPNVESFDGLGLGLRKNPGVKEKANQIFSRMSLTDGRSKQQQQQAKQIVSRATSTKGSHILETGASSMRPFIEAGWKPKKGFQLRYIYFLNKVARERLSVPVLPFSKIEEMGAAMYKGEKITRVKQAMTGDQLEQRRSDTDPPAPIEKAELEQ
jgi:hypothetical protein